MKTNKKIYNDILKYENVLSIFNKIKRNCKNKEAVYNFKLNLNTNIYNILRLLLKSVEFCKKVLYYQFSKNKIHKVLVNLEV